MKKSFGVKFDISDPKGYHIRAGNSNKIFRLCMDASNPCSMMLEPRKRSDTGPGHNVRGQHHSTPMFGVMQVSFECIPSVIVFIKSQLISLLYLFPICLKRVTTIQLLRLDHGTIQKAVE
jgi:hypothetical protein